MLLLTLTHSDYKSEGYLKKVNFLLQRKYQDFFPLVLLQQKYKLAPMGVLAPGSAHARPSARLPIDTSGNFSAHMSGGGKLSDSFSDQLSRQIREF